MQDDLDTTPLSPVQSAPNASVIRGRIVKVSPHPAGAGNVWDVAVDEALPVHGLRNLAKSQEGATMQVQVHPELQAEVGEMDWIEAEVTFAGDESGGQFFLQGEKVRKL